MAGKGGMIITHFEQSMADWRVSAWEGQPGRTMATSSSTLNEGLLCSQCYIMSNETWIGLCYQSMYCEVWA